MLTSYMELRSYHIEHCSHVHDFAQLVLPIAGSMELEVGHHFSKIKEDIGVYIAPNERHCFSGSQDNLFLVIDVEDAFLNKNTLPAFFNVTSSTKKLIQFAHHYLIHNERDFYIDSLINQLLFRLPTEGTHGNPKVIKAKHWMDKHFALPVNIEQLAKHCCISSSQLQRLFKQHTGFGLAQYWRMKKLQQAKRLLLSRSFSIEAIAFELGYEHVSAFSRCFSKVFGESPLQWQKKVLNVKNMQEMDN